MSLFQAMHETRDPSARFAFIEDCLPHEEKQLLQKEEQRQKYPDTIRAGQLVVNDQHKFEVKKEF